MTHIGHYNGIDISQLFDIGACIFFTSAGFFVFCATLMLMVTAYQDLFPAKRRKRARNH